MEGHKIFEKMLVPVRSVAATGWRLGQKKEQNRLHTKFLTQSELLTREQLAECAEALAVGDVARRDSSTGKVLFKRFARQALFIRRAYFSLAEAARKSEPLTPGAEWLLDNNHVIREHIQSIRNHMPRGYYRSLPKLTEGPYRGYPRVYHLALQYICHTDGVVESELLSGFVAAYQKQQVLSIGELWAFPSMLRLALIERITLLTDVNLRAHRERMASQALQDEVLRDETISGTELLQRVIKVFSSSSDHIETSAVSLLRELRIRGKPALLTVQWLEERLRELGVDPGEEIKRAQKEQVGNQISIANTVTSLNAVSSIDWKKWFESLSVVDQILRKDPDDLYRKSDFITRDRCRKVIETIAFRLRGSEVEIARSSVARAEQSEDDPNCPGIRSVLYYLIDDGLPGFEKSVRYPVPWYERFRRLCSQGGGLLYGGGIAAVLALTLGLIWSIIGSAPLSVSLPLLLLWFLPASEFALRVVQWIVTLCTHPTVLPKMDFEAGIPDSCRTAVAVHSLFDSKDSIQRALDALLVRQLGNQDDNLRFVILGDFWPAPTEETPHDAELLQYACEAVTALNDKIGKQRFFLFLRKRVWSETESQYMGWERKRGKVVEFNRLLLGDMSTTLISATDSVVDLVGCKYVITLDADSQLPPSSAHKLVGAMAHSLNKAVVDEETQTVVRGYGVIQPQVAVSLPSSQQSLYAAISAGEVGFDPYTSAASEVYQDLFGAGLYLGKGIYEVETFERVLSDRVPEGSLLSHDLFEGLFTGVGFASDLRLIDDTPTKYNSHAMRFHRWVRGDWQLLPWVRSHIPVPGGARIKTPLTFLARWKLVDNLRRSLVTPFQFTAIVAGLVLLEPTAAAALVLLVLCFYIFPIVTLILNALWNIQFGYSFRAYCARLLTRMSRSASEIILQLTWLPSEAYLLLDAIGTTLYRVYVSRRRLLEWQTADFSERTLGRGIRTYIRQFAPGVLLTLFSLGLVGVLAPENLALGAPFFALWIGSPFIAAYISEPVRRANQRISKADRGYLRALAWDTWLFFDEHITAENNFLMPDNLQEVPDQLVANRTSPTNLGLSLMSIYSAYDFGFIPLPAALQRIESVCDTLMRLERYRGHLYNWYEVDSLRILNPGYISFVDSGNFVAFVMSTQSATRTAWFDPMMQQRHFHHIERWLKNKSFLTREMTGENGAALRELSQALTDVGEGFDGIYDVLQALGRVSTLNLQEQIDELSVPRSVARRTLQRFQKVSKHYDDLLEVFAWYPNWRRLASILEEEERGEDGGHVKLVRQVKTVRRILEARAPSLSLLSKILRRLHQLSEDVQTLYAGSGQPEIEQLLLEFRLQLDRGRRYLETRRAGIKKINEQLETLVTETDFAFLYDQRKELFHIGYDVDEAHLDNSRYDLLASEARLGSFVAIALGQVKEKHWVKMRRAFARSYGELVLLSWSGTMFEYLMPLLVMKEYGGTLLDLSNRATVRAQQEYGHKRGVPWGVSESGYSGVDFQKNYQYRAFGVPGLGLKRGLADDLVVSPYATALALMVAPRKSIANLRELERNGARGMYGFYEAIDYTTERLHEDEDKSIVQSFFAHHQGMALVAVSNLLHAGIFQERFHADPHVKAFELLLHEKFPEWVATFPPHQAEVSYLEVEREEEKSKKSEFLSSPHTRVPRTRVLSNGRYSVAVDNAGSGFSRMDGTIAINRWREDPAVNDYGMYTFVRDIQGERVWSATHQPTLVEADSYQVIFNPDKVEFKRADGAVRVHTEIVVSPEDNVEIRRITVTNTGSVDRSVELTSYSEIALCPQAADEAHPAFAKMFVQSEFDPHFDALLFTRRPRSDKERPMFAFHMVTMNVCWSPTQFETARVNFLGRGRTIRNPQAMQSGQDLSGTTGLILDPVAALRTRLEVKAGSAETACFITGFVESREECAHLMQLYHDSHTITRAFEMAWSQSNVELRHEQYSIAQTHVFQQLANCIIHSVPGMRGTRESVERNTLTQSGFWRFGISGDMPIVLVRLNDPQQLKVAQEVLVAHEYLRIRGIRFDAVLLNEYPGGYFQDFQGALDTLVHSGPFGTRVDTPGGVYLRNRTQVNEQEIQLLLATARVVIEGRKGSLAQQIILDDSLIAPLASRRGLFNYLTDNEDHYEQFSPPQPKGIFNNGIGSFAPDGKSYQMQVRHTARPPMPWSNIIANPDFGFMVTESGGGYTWARNSRENRLTPWSNDPVSDSPGEVLYIRDTDTGAYWCPTPSPIPQSGAVAVRHAFGWSEFQTQQKGIFSNLTISGSMGDSVKWYSLKLTNGDYVARTLEVYFYVEWVLGVNRADAYRYHLTEFQPSENCLQLRNRYNNEFADGIAYIGANRKISGYTTDRQEFLGRNRGKNAPYFLERGVLSTLTNLIKSSRGKDTLSGECTTLGDSCGVVCVQVDLEPREEKEALFYLAYSEDSEEALASALRYRSPKVRDRALTEVQEFWHGLTGSVQVYSPDDSFNILMNGWLLYQNLSCRIWGRSAFFQSGGAFGFRDQLQDVMALLYSRPDYVREQILLHASRQFVEGDVQHWWHPPTGRGVRTRISDDYLWLPYVTLRYLEVTGDTSVLDERVSYIEGQLLESGQMETYIVPEKSEHAGTVYEHCILALDRSLSFGPHGLPLIGCGDWNDGMNEVGVEGRGESVWLGWFIYDLLKRFAPLVEKRNDQYRSGLYRKKADDIVANIEKHAWDGNWYLRAFFDDGTPLGSAQNDECQIDSLAQSWSILTGGGQPERAMTALKSVFERLVRPDLQIICLLDPPFDKGSLDPGYIKGYLPGVRENGGQYTHAATWVVMATAAKGLGNKAYELFQMINPINHGRTAEEMRQYQGEPYVTCGDVYSVSPHEGRAGWSWYTGSGAWLYRIGLESIVGLQVYPEHFEVHPCIPEQWNEFSFNFVKGLTTYVVTVKNPDGVQHGVRRVAVNGVDSDQKKIVFDSEGETDQRTVFVEVLMG